MVNKYYQNEKKDSKKKHVKDIKIFLKKRKILTFYWRRKRKKSVSIIRNVRRSYLTIKEIIS